MKFDSCSIHQVSRSSRFRLQKTINASPELRFMLTFCWPKNHRPSDKVQLLSELRAVLDALRSLGISGLCVIEFGSDRQLSASSVPHLHILIDKLHVEKDFLDELNLKLRQSLRWFGRAYAQNPSILHVEPIHDLKGAARYLAKIGFKQKQKRIPKLYWPLKRLMRTFGSYKNPLNSRVTSDFLTSAREWNVRVTKSEVPPSLTEQKKKSVRSFERGPKSQSHRDGESRM